MRRYTTRERVLSGVAGGVIAFFVAFPLAYFALTDGSMRAIALLCASLAFWGGVGVFAKIAVTGTSATFIDRVVRPRGLADNQRPHPSTLGSLVSDILNAAVANLVALVLGMVSAPIAIAFPLGIFGVYMLLVAVYAWFQFRTGRTQRAILACAIAPIVTIVFAVNVRIA